MIAKNRASDLIRISRVFGLMLVFTYCAPLHAQVFVRTILDRPASKVSSPPNLATFVGSLPPDLQSQMRVMSIDSNTKFLALNAGQKSTVADAALDSALAGLDALTNDEALAKCDDVAWALKNRWAPVKWKSERSVCFWSQPSFDWARAAQIAGGNDEGTASVELASDVFWGIRLRIQTAVSGTSGDGTDAKAKALLQQLITSGGNLSIGGTYPWYAYESSTKRVAGVLTSFTRVGGTLSALGGDSNATSQTIKSGDVNGSVELAPIDAQLQIQSFRRSINFVIAGRLDVVNGSHKFNETIGNSGHRGFAYGQLGVGLRFAEVLWVTASWKKFTSDSLPGNGKTYTIMVGK